ncbi:MAG: hypothetical protein FD138_2280 [Planctomycetota bacterium]|nr:MAG: hypothetical protein FD138_2280 [Planctomycetota bacterium]
MIGVAGCTAASCHGGKSLIGGEATAWLTRDAAHRRAYDVLFDETSVRMAKQLGLKAAHTEARCLACHSTDSAAPHALNGERFSLEFGVGCESCHGTAGDWIARHTERSWRSRSPDSKSALGFRDLRSLTVRAETCAACHVGSPRATVDHDLIAAGHPRLAFEMSAYHDLLPKHWDSAAELRHDPAQPVRLWAIGHGASAKAMSNISAARAESAINSGAKHVTPDLAEFDCQACHHDLAEPTRGRPTLRSPLGSPRWGSWSVAPAQFAACQSQTIFGSDGTGADASLKTLLDLIQNSRLGTAPADMLLTNARQSSRELAAWSRSIEDTPSDSNQSHQLLQRLLAAESDGEWLPTWDGQAQRYLAVIAAARTTRQITGREAFSPAGIAELLPKLRKQLSYSQGYNTPHDFSASDVDRLLLELRNHTSH